MPADRNDEVYARASNSFLNVAFFKPAEGSNPDLTFRLAPLILQEVGDTNPPAVLRRDWIGAPDTAPPPADSAPSQPVVYVETDSLQINGRAHLRLTYLWRYAGAPARPAGATVQGIRITLNTAGEPAVWEVLAEDSSAQILFVADSVESAARAQYGAPLSGRRFAVERSLDEAPNTIVARVIDDGPTPMGPIIYLRAGTRSVATLTCRCMPAQAKNVVANNVYRLVPVQRFAENPDWLAVWAQQPNQLAFPITPEPGQSRIERCLRLPVGF